MRPLLAILFLTSLLPATAAEVAVLNTGARIRAQRVEDLGDKFVLFEGQGRIEIDRSLIASFEHEDDPAPLPTATPVQTPAAGFHSADPKALVTAAALRHGLPPEIVHALAITESAYRTDALSPKGAIGVMQLMPATARALSADPKDVEQNIDAGTRLLRDLLVKYENNPNPVRRALAAYNAGAAAVDRYNGVPPYRETQDYVEKVLERYWRAVRANAVNGSR
jgi:soluble lytic murein transglycosylase-like protein